MPTSRLDAFDNCRELWRECQRWLGDIEATRLAHNRAFTEAMLEQYREFLIALSRPRSMRHKRVR